MLAIVWWMYGGYAWLTNLVPPDRTARRLAMVAGMISYLVLALAIPRAFEGEGLRVRPRLPAGRDRPRRAVHGLDAGAAVHDLPRLLPGQRGVRAGDRGRRGAGRRLAVRAVGADGGRCLGVAVPDRGPEPPARCQALRGAPRARGAGGDRRVGGGDRDRRKRPHHRRGHDQHRGAGDGDQRRSVVGVLRRPRRRAARGGLHPGGRGRPLPGGGTPVRPGVRRTPGRGGGGGRRAAPRDRASRQLDGHGARALPGRGRRPVPGRRPDLACLHGDRDQPRTAGHRRRRPGHGCRQACSCRTSPRRRWWRPCWQPGSRSRADQAGAATPARSSNPCSSTRPSVEPTSCSTACSGCGISAATLPSALVTQATEPTEPLGLSR